MTSSKKKKRISPDWEAIFTDLRAGILSKREVGRKHKVDPSYMIRKAKAAGVKADLSKRVKQAVQAKLVHENVYTTNAKDDDVIDNESDKLVAIVKLQRKDIANLREIEQKLVAELSGEPNKLYITQYQGKIVSEAVGLSVAERSAAAANLAQVQHKRIALERQAFNLDERGEPDERTIKVIYDNPKGLIDGD